MPFGRSPFCFVENILACVGAGLEDLDIAMESYILNNSFGPFTRNVVPRHVHIKTVRS
jgi:hypothetical protein